MKLIEELTKEECQTFLNEMFDESVEFERIIFDGDCTDGCGIEYKTKRRINEDKQNIGIVSFSNPELIAWLYENEIDITIPLKQLKIDFIEMDETNSTLFQYAMEINEIVSKYKTDKYNESHDIGNYMMKSAALDEIKQLQKDLIKKI